MRSHPGLFRLTFLLPAGSQADSGRHQPSPDGCTLEITFPFVEITGPSREATFEHATRLVRTACRGRHAITALLQRAYPELGLRRSSGGDTWHITVGADVSFSPTSLDPYLPRETTRPPPLELITGGRSA